jgi:hypothetical protein
MHLIALSLLLGLTAAANVSAAIMFLGQRTN